MQTISVPLQNRSYPIWIENDLINKLPELLKPLNQDQKWVVFSQEKIFNHYGKTLINSLQNAGFSVESIIYSDGEEAKSLTVLGSIYPQLIEMGCDRSSTFLALGGGVVGDVTGYIAATFMRGVDYIQIPTTLLAMVDSSIGGKTGVNLPDGKNLVGAIWQPKAVVVDPKLLNSLPKREVASALGEVIKYGAILDRKFFDLISKNLDNLLDLANPSLLTDVIARCAKLKADIVADDEREGDKRRILNFGHTNGHALETHFGFDTLRHGEAIAYGMMAAGKLSIKNSGLKSEDCDYLKNTIQRLPLPELPDFDQKEILNIIENDKKVISGSLHFILLENIGSAVVQNNISDQSIISVLEAL